MKHYLTIPFPARVALLLVALALSLATPSGVRAVGPADDGAWSSPETLLQGFVVQYAPVADPAIVLWWFTYDEDGNQAWFISENIPLDSNGSEQTVGIFKPMCSFVSDSRECFRGDAVGAIAYSASNERISIRFAIAAIEGYSGECAIGLPIALRPSPLPPPFPAGVYPCQGELSLQRITPAIPELLGL